MHGEHRPDPHLANEVRSASRWPGVLGGRRRGAIQATRKQGLRMKLALPPRRPRKPRSCRGAGNGASDRPCCARSGVDEAVDALVGDHLAAGLARQPAGDLFGDQPHFRRVDYRTAQEGLPLQACALPAPCSPSADPHSSACSRAACPSLRFISREIVDGERSRAAAICRIEHPSARESGNLAPLIQK